MEMLVETAAAMVEAVVVAKEEAAVAQEAAAVAKAEAAVAREEAMVGPSPSTSTAAVVGTLRGRSTMGTAARCAAGSETTGLVAR